MHGDFLAISTRLSIERGMEQYAASTAPVLRSRVYNSMVSDLKVDLCSTPTRPY